MITYQEYIAARTKAAELLKKSGVVVSGREIENMDVADFGLSNLSVEGAQIVSLVETDAP